MAEPVGQAIGRDEVGERADAVDLDHRQVLAIRRLERGIATDVDELEVEGVTVAHLGDDLDRAFAEVTAGRVVDGDAARCGCAERAGRRVGRRAQG